MSQSAIIFPGQGSQSEGMLSELLESRAVVRETFEEASDIMKLDLAHLSQNDPDRQMNLTYITQPIVLVASVAVWRVYKEMGGPNPDYVAGHSLGEYTALVCNEGLSFSEAVALVHLRGKLMQSAVPEGKGAMAAILGLDDDTLQQACAEAAQDGCVAAANFNAPGQTVISGDVQALDRAIDLAKTSGARKAAMLPISVPCHSDLMKPAAEELAQALDQAGITLGQIELIQNVSSKVPENQDELMSNLLKHLYSPVFWRQGIEVARELGCETFIECGPGKVLTGLMKRIDKSAQSQFMNDLSSIEAAVERLTVAS